MKIESLPQRYRDQIALKYIVKNGEAIMQPVKRKYRNEPCINAQGMKFDSKLERKHYEQLCAEHGEKNVIRQVSLPIGSRRLRPDFMVIMGRYEDGSFRCKLWDSKGFETREWGAKVNHLLDKHYICVYKI